MAAGASWTHVTDPADPRVNDYRVIKDVGRRVAGTFIAESELVIDRLLASTRFPVRSLLLTPQRATRLADRLAGVTAPVLVAEPSVLDAIVGFPLHRGALAIASRVALPTAESLLGQSRRVVVLEDVVDPDNVGSIFRHAAAFGADAVLLSANAGDPLYRKAVRTSMGLVLRVPYARIESRQTLVGLLDAAGFRSLALTPAADAVDLRTLRCDEGDRVALLLGAEGPGLTESTMTAATQRVRIPIAGDVDSLNVASAAAIAMYALFDAQR